MLKAILKAFAKLFIAVVVIRLGILAAGIDFAVRETTGMSPMPLEEMREMGREAFDAVSRVLQR